VVVWLPFRFMSGHVVTSPSSDHEPEAICPRAPPNLRTSLPCLSFPVKGALPTSTGLSASLALAEVDDKSFFTAAAVRGPLRTVADRPDLDIPNFSRHLKEMSDQRRGGILVREGETRRLRYRFVNPLMRPYVIMRGVADGLLTSEKREAISSIA
jgi:hypothetical protein